MITSLQPTLLGIAIALCFGFSSATLLYAADQRVWRVRSGTWDLHDTPNKNRVLLHHSTFDPELAKTPLHLIYFHTSYPMYRDIYKQKNIYFSTIQFDYTFQEYYTPDKSGSLAIYLSGDHYTEILFLEFETKNRILQSVSLRKTRVLDRAKDVKAYGNYTVDTIAQTKTYISTQNPLLFSIKQSPSELTVAINRRILFRFRKNEALTWKILTNQYFHFGVRGMKSWFDNVSLYIKDKNAPGAPEKLYLKEDFSGAELKKMTIKVRLIPKNEK